jgi:hypothetical protein
VTARGTLAAALAVGALAGCGSPDRAAAIESQLARQLADRSLSAKWVRCVGRPGSAYRCNVSFGDPHVQIYCATLVDGRLRAAEWRQAVRGRLDREAAARECARRLDVKRSR